MGKTYNMHNVLSSAIFFIKKLLFWLFFNIKIIALHKLKYDP